MGGRVVLPEQDLYIQKVIKTFDFKPEDIAFFLKVFDKMDKKKTGFVALSVIFERIHCERNYLTDCLLDLLEIEHDGELNFSEFLFMIVSYAFFDKKQILQFCFFSFDQDKTGFFAVDDLNNLLNVMHRVGKGETVVGNVKTSWMNLTFSDTQFEFTEFEKIHNKFPRLFEPAFKLQFQMKFHFKGESWWDSKKSAIDRRKEIADRKLNAKKKRKEDAKRRKKNRKIMRNMGCLRYYLCPCIRMYYDYDLTNYDKLSVEDKAERDKKLAELRRQADLKVKNPETAEWLAYKRKVVDNTEVMVIEAEEQPKLQVVVEPLALDRITDGVSAIKKEEVDANMNKNASAAAVGGTKKTPVTVIPEVDDPSVYAAIRHPKITAAVPKNKVLVNNFLDEKLQASGRNRETRAELRAERKRQRADDPELKLKPRTTVSGVSF